MSSFLFLTVAMTIAPQLRGKNRLIFLVVILFGTLVVAYFIKTATNTSSHPLVIAHGGTFKTQIDSKPREFLSTNSLEAMNANYSVGHRYFETDFEWTSDNYLAAIHDWKKAWSDYFGTALTKHEIPTLDTFLQTEMKYQLTQQTPSSINEWLTTHPETYIITDIKRRNIEGLQQILALNSDLVKERYIPQIYHFKEYAAVKEMGFKRIILTLYQLSQNEADTEQLLRFIDANSIYAVTIHVDKVRSSDIVAKLCERGTFVYAHPVVDMKLFQELRKRGVYGVYSYTFKPSDFSLDMKNDRLPCELQTTNIGE